MVMGFTAMAASVELAGARLLVLRSRSCPVRLVPFVVCYPLCTGYYGSVFLVRCFMHLQLHYPYLLTWYDSVVIVVVAVVVVVVVVAVVVLVAVVVVVLVMVVVVAGVVLVVVVVVVAVVRWLYQVC